MGIWEVSEMYKTSTFLTSMFCKFNVKDTRLRKHITDLYRPIITTILESVPTAKKVAVFRELLYSVQHTLTFLRVLYKSSVSPLTVSLALCALQSSIDFDIYLIKKVGIRTESSRGFNDIMKQVHLPDLACDIGDCIKAIKSTQDINARVDLNTRLSVLLTDYNLVAGKSLTVAEVLGP